MVDTVNRLGTNNTKFNKGEINTMLSVIIPSYRNPKYLDLCINSALKTQTEKNEIIVVLDGFISISSHIIEKYKNEVAFLEFEENRGMQAAINFGVYNATNNDILVVSEDNIFPKNWDLILNNKIKELQNNFILTPNQIEPTGPSIYNFKFYNFGETADNFNLEKFIENEPNFREDKMTNDGGTFPFCMKKRDFMKIGGFDTSYNSPFVVDWDFFLKAELCNMNLYRLHSLNFYHFVSKSTKNRDGISNSNEKKEFFKGEEDAMQFFKYKWGFHPQRDKNNRCSQFLNF